MGQWGGGLTKEEKMAGHHYIYISGFAEEKWDAKVGVVSNPDGARQSQRVVLKKGGEQSLDSLLPRLEREANPRNNQPGVSR